MSLGSRYDVKPSPSGGPSSSGYPTPPAPSGGGVRGVGGGYDDDDNLIAWNPRNDGNQAHHIHQSPGSSKRGGGGRSSMGSIHSSHARGPSSSVPRGGDHHAGGGGVELFGGGGSNAGDAADELETLGSIHYSLSRLYEEMNGQDFDKFIAEIESFDMPVERFRPWLKNESLKKALKDSTQQTTPRPGGITTPAVGEKSVNGSTVTTPRAGGVGGGASHNNAATGGSAPGTPRSGAGGASSAAPAPGSSWESFATRHKPRLHGGAPRGNTEDMQQLLEEEGQMLAPVRSESIAPETSGRDFNCATASFISRQYEELNRKDIIIEELQIRNGFVMHFSHANHAALQAERMQAERHLLEKCNFLETNQEESRSIATGGILDIEAAARTQMEKLQDEVLRELSNEMVRMQVVTKATHDSSKLSWIDMQEERARHNLILDADRTLHYIFSDHFTALHDFMLNLRHHNSRPQNYYEGVNPYTITDPRDPMQGIEDNHNNHNQPPSGNNNMNKSGEYPRTPRTPRGGGGGEDGGGRTSGNTSSRRHHTPQNGAEATSSLPQRDEFIDGLLNKNVANKQQDMLQDAEGPAKERMDASLDERHKKRDEVRRRQAAAEEAALKRKEAAQKRKDFQNRRENDISMALGSSRATPKSAQKRSGSPKSMTSGADGSSSLDGSYSNVPVSVMLARRAAAAKKTPDQIVQEADDFTDDNTTHNNGALSTGRSGGGATTSASGRYSNNIHHQGGGMSASGGDYTARDSDVDPWAASIGRKALADLAQFPPFYGWLYKSQGVLMSWQRRYFVLTRTGKIKYTTQDPTIEGATVKWILLLHAEDITRVEVDMFQDSSAGVRPPVDQYHSNCFYIDAVSNHDDHDAKGRPRRFKFCCRNKSEMTRWMHNLRKATDVVYTLEESGLVPRSPVREHFRKMFALLSPLLAGGGVMSGNGGGADGEEDDIPAYRRRVQMEDDIAALEVQQRESDERERRQEEEDRRLGQLSPTRRGRSASPAPARSAAIDA